MEPWVILAGRTAGETIEDKYRTQYDRKKDTMKNKLVNRAEHVEKSRHWILCTLPFDQSWQYLP